MTSSSIATLASIAVGVRVEVYQRFDRTQITINAVNDIASAALHQNVGADT